MDLEELRVKFEADGTEATAVAVKKLQQDVTKSLGKLVAGFMKANAEGARLNRTLTRLGKQDVNIRVNMTDLAPYNVQVEKLRDDLRDVRGSYTARVKVNVNEDSVSRVKQQLDDIDRRSRDSAFLDLLGDTGRASSGVLATAGSLTTLAGGLTTAAVAGGAFSQALIGITGGGVVGILGGLSAGALAVGGAFASAGAGVAAFATLAIPSLSKVFKAQEAYRKASQDLATAQAMGDKDAIKKALEDQNAALATLTPAQRAAVDSTEALYQTWQKAGMALEPTVLATYTQGVQTLGQFLPTLIPVADGVGEAFEGLLATMEKSIDSDEFRATMDAIAESAPRMVTAFGEIAFGISDAFATGFRNGMPLIDATMEGLVGWAGRLDDAFESQAFADFVQFGLDMLPHLGDLFGALGGLVVAFGQAFAPLAPIVTDLFTGLANGLSETLSSSGMDAFVQGIIDLLPIAGAAVQALGGAFGSLATALGPLVPVVMETIGALGEGLSGLFESDAASRFVKALGQLLPAAVGPLEILGTAFLELIAAVAEGLVPVLPVLGDSLKKLLPPFVSLVQTIAGTLSPVLETLLPPFADLIALLAGENGLGGLLQLVGGHIVNMLPALSALAEGVIGMVSAVLPALGTVMQAVSDALTPEVYATVTQAFIDMAPALVSIGESFAQLLVAVTPLIPPLVELAVALLPIFVQGIQNAAKTISVLTDLLTPLIRFGVEQLSASLGVLIPVVEFVVDAFSLLFDVFSDVYDALANGDWSAIGDILTDAFWGFVDIAANAGAEIAGALIDGIMSMGGELTGAADWMMSKIGDFLPHSPAKEGPFSGQGWSMYSGESIAEDLAAGMMAKQQLVSTAASGLAAAASPTSSVSLLTTPTLDPVAAAPQVASRPREFSVATRGSITVNGLTAANAPEGSTEAQVLALLEERDRQWMDILEQITREAD